MSVYAFQRNFNETFPCGTKLTPCESCQQKYLQGYCNGGQYLQGYCNSGQYLQGYCPVEYDNFVADTKVPFFLEKYREIYNTLTSCKNCYDKNIYYTDVSVPVNQHILLVKPYFLNSINKVNNSEYGLHRIKQKFEEIIY